MLADHIDEIAALGIDYADAIERFAGNGALFQKLVMRFLDDPHFAAMQAAMEVGDADAAYREAHSLKGVAGNLSCVVLFKRTDDLCIVLKQGDLETARAQMPEVAQAYDNVILALETYA